MHRKTSTFRTFPYDSYAPFDLEELDESESFAEFRFGTGDIRILKEVLQMPDMITCSQRSVCDGLEYTCQLFLRYRREISILGVLGFLKTTFPKTSKVFKGF